MPSKVVSLREAVAAHVRDGDTLAIEGFTHLIGFAAAHEVIRQGRRDLTLARLTPDLVYDQLVAAGCASKLVFSWLGNPGVGSLHAIRRAIEAGELEIEEYSHHGMVARYAAGAEPIRERFTERGPVPGASSSVNTVPRPVSELSASGAAMIPALLIRRCSGRFDAMNEKANASMDAGSARSIGTSSTRGTPSTAFFALSGVRTGTITVAPARASTRVVSRPMPE